MTEERTRPPRELKLLGGVRLYAEGADVTTEVRKRHLAALLVLAGAGTESVSRETLIGLLWPDHDPERARNNLSQALHGLRRVLGDAAIIATRSEVRLSRDHVSVDLWRFQAGIRAGGSLAASVAEYDGPFADGFDAAELDDLMRWLGERREQLAAAHRAALTELAETAEAEGHPQAAVARWQELSRNDPLSTAPAVGLIRALAAAGDKPAALEHERKYRARLRQELGTDPDPSVTELADSLREPPADPDGADAPPAAPTLDSVGPSPVPEGAHPPVEVAASPAGASRVPGALLRRALLPIGVLLALAVILVSLPAVRGPDSAAGPDEPLAVAVLPFTVTGTLEGQGFGRGIVGLLAASLDGAGSLRSVSSGRVLEAVGDGKDLLPADAAAVARQVGARLFVLGEIVEAGGTLRMSAAMYEEGGDGAPLSKASVEGSSDEFLILADRLAAQLISDRFRRPGERLARAASASTTSLVAVKAYLAGEDLFRVGRYAEAADAFAQATAADSAFALAYFRQAMAADMAGRDAVARYAAARALALRERISEHDARLVEGYVAWREGELDTALRQLRQLVAEYPDDAESWLAIGMILMQSNPLHGRPSEEARPAFERVLALDADNAEALLSLARLADLAGRTAAADSLEERIARVRADQRVATLRSFRAFVFGDSPGRKPSTGYVLAVEDVASAEVQLHLATHADDLATQDRFARALLEQDPANADNPAHRMLARSALAAGRLREADEQLSASGAADSPRNLLLVGLHGAYDFLPLNRSRTSAALQRLRAWTPPRAVAGEAGSDLFLRMIPELRLHRIGLLASRLGELDNAIAAADSIDRIQPTAEEERVLARMLSSSVRAHVAMERGRPEEVLEWLDRASWPLGADLFESEAYDRWLLAEALEALDRKDEALAWYTALGERSAVEVALRVPAAMRMAGIHDARGESAQAIRHYRRVTQLWGAADQELRPIVERAAARLAELD